MMTVTTMNTNATTTAKTMMASTAYSPSGPNSPPGIIYSQTEAMFRSVLTYFSAGGAATATETAETETTTETATESMMAMAEATMTAIQGSEAEDKDEWRRCSEKLRQIQGPDEPGHCMWDEAGMMERVRRGTSPL
jgi:hypothetical protein